MRKFLTLAAAVALLALGSVNEAKAQASVLGMGCEGGCTVVQSVGGTVAVAATAGMWVYVLGGAVVKDIMAGGLNRKYAEAIPGAGYHSVDMARTAELQHEFNVAMGYGDDADTTKYLASAAR